MDLQTIKARLGDPEKRNKHLDDRSYDLNLKLLFQLAFKLPEALVIHVVQEIPDEMRNINADWYFLTFEDLVTQVPTDLL